MKHVRQALAKRKESDLPEEIRQSIKDFKKLIETYNGALQTLEESGNEEDEETAKELDALKEEVENNDKEIAKQIKAYFENEDLAKAEQEKKIKEEQAKSEQAKEEQAKEEQAKAEQAKAEQEAKFRERVQLQRQKESEVKEQEKKKSSTGWLIFGGVVLLATLGAVNMMKKRS
jgi:hypothetical protein